MLDRVKCPICGNPINRVWFSQVDHIKMVAEFVAECWSGDLHRHSTPHIFLVKIQLKAETTHTDAFITITEKLQSQLEELGIDVEAELQNIVDLKKA